jgi:hypothetical protein
VNLEVLWNGGKPDHPDVRERTIEQSLLAKDSSLKDAAVLVEVDRKRQAGAADWWECRGVWRGNDELGIEYRDCVDAALAKS